MRTFFETRLKELLLRATARRAEFAAKDEGSLTIFSLFLFILILYISGMAVDLIRYENERVAVQNAIDTGIVAASSLTQTADTDAEITALVKDYVAKAGYDPDMVTVTPSIEIPAGSTVATSRAVSASVDFQMDTMFMNMMGVNTLGGHAGGSAREGQQLIEIALVLDVSGSMGSNSKLDNLKTAAKEFVTIIIEKNGQERVSISVIPYNQQVHMSTDLMSRLNLEDQLLTVSGAAANSGAIENYQTRNQAAPCARFHDDDFNTRRLSATTNIDTSASFVDDYFYWALGVDTNVAYEQPFEFSFWCGSHNPTMMLYQNSETVLHNYIDSFAAYGATAIDYGMNWAVGILDPSFEPVVAGMVTDGLAPDSAAGHPVAFATEDVLKYIVVMTDGQNTDHFDLKDQYKSGPTRIWYSDTMANGNEQNGFLVEMPNGPASERWYVPRSPLTSADDQYLHQNARPADAQQWDFHQLYRRFRTNDVAKYFFKYSDPTAYAEYLDVVDDVGGYAAADTNLQNICTTAKANGYIEIFTVAFEAPANGEAVLQNCASKAGNYFDVAGTQISAAFSSIASQISQLRLTE